MSCLNLIVEKHFFLLCLSETNTFWNLNGGTQCLVRTKWRELWNWKGLKTISAQKNSWFWYRKCELCAFAKLTKIRVPKFAEIKATRRPICVFHTSLDPKRPPKLSSFAVSQNLVDGCSSFATLKYFLHRSGVWKGLESLPLDTAE